MLVFVSYSRQNSEFVLRLVTDLRGKNIPLWLDQTDIPTGKRWDREIEKALETATHFLLVMSQASNDSDNVRDEIDFAIDAGKPIIPILLDDSRPPLRVRRMQYTDFRGEYAPALQKLLGVLPMVQPEKPAEKIETAHPKTEPPPTDKADSKKLETRLSSADKVENALKTIENPKSRWFELVNAAKSLGMNGDEKVLPTLGKLLQHPELDVQRAAQEAIATLQNALPNQSKNIPAKSDETSKPATAKFVVTGPYLAGKTTMIHKVSEIDVKSRESGRDSGGDDKVMMDFGRISIDNQLTVYLFGTPGQSRFDFMWEILGEGSSGYFLVVDSTRPETFFEARMILDTFMAYQSDDPKPFIVLANKQDLPDALSPEQIRTLLRIKPDNQLEVIKSVTTDKENVMQSVRTLLLKLLDSFDNPLNYESYLLPLDTPLINNIQKIAPLDIGKTHYIVPEASALDIELVGIEACEKVGAFLNAPTVKRWLESEFSPSRLSATFGKFAYLVASYKGQMMGVARFYVENLVGIVELFVAPEFSPAVVGEALLNKVKERCTVLSAEVLIGINSDDKNIRPIYEANKYEYINLNRGGVVKAWARACLRENQDSIAYLKLLDQPIIKPI